MSESSLPPTHRAWRWQGIDASQAHNKCKIKKQKVQVMSKRKIEKRLPEPQPNSEQMPIDTTSSPANAKPHVIGSQSFVVSALCQFYMNLWNRLKDRYWNWYWMHPIEHMDRFDKQCRIFLVVVFLVGLIYCIVAFVL